MRFIILVVILALVLISGCTRTELVEEVIQEATQEETITSDTPVISKPNITEKTPRWGKESFKVFIDEESSGGVFGFEQRFIEIFKQSVQKLNNDVNNKFSFTFTNERDADMVVKWVSALPSNSLDAIGHTELKFSVGPSFNVINSAEISLLASKDGRELTDNQVMLLSMHELGHALGLDHSQNKKSIMFPQLQDDISDLHAEDIEAISQLYKVAPLPDLKIQNTYVIKRVISQGFTKYYLADVNFSIVNDGLSDAEKFGFLISVGDRDVENNSTLLKPGSIYTIKYTNISSATDFSEIIIKVDPENKIKELNESNTKIIRIEKKDG